MASDPIPGIDIRPEPFPLNGNHTQLISHLPEEVGFLSGVLMTLDLNSNDRSAIRQETMDHWRKLADARRAADLLPDSGRMVSESGATTAGRR